MAAEMRSQIDTLRQIADEPALIGQYAAKLRTSSADLAAKLGKVVGRYEQVSGHLEKWGPELAGYQAATLEALEKARTAEDIRTANAPAAVPAGPPAPVDEARVRAAQSALDDAACILRQAQSQMMTAVEDARRRGREIADLIDDATDDDVKDSRWDNVKDAIHRHAAWLKDVTQYLGYITTAVALIAIFVPGLNMIVLGYTVLLAAGHLALALSGDGSWADLALDVVALATFGVGARLAKGMESAHAAARAGAARAAAAQAERAALAESRAVRTAAGEVASGSGARAAAARVTVRAAKAEARAAAARAAREVREVPLPKPGMGELWAAKEPSLAPRMMDVGSLRARFPGNARVMGAADAFDRGQSTNQKVWTTGAFADLGDKAGERMLPEYTEFKGRFTAEVGSTW
jgi:hypothetical protein